MKDPVPKDEISEEMIAALVHGFYGKVRADAVLGPIFNGIIGENWDVHLTRMCDFWSSVMRMTGRYKGEPFTTHYRYIDTYVRRDGRWQVVSVQTTKVREAAAN